MANTYLEFSEIIEDLTPEEMDWWENDADNIGNEDDNTVCYDYGLERDRKIVWFHSDECGNIEAVAMVVQAFLVKFRPDDYFSLTWACWCSKPRLGEFGGGTIFITAKNDEFHNAHCWLQERIEKWEKNRVV